MTEKADPGELLERKASDKADVRGAVCGTTGTARHGLLDRPEARRRHKRRAEPSALLSAFAALADVVLADGP